MADAAPPPPQAHAQVQRRRTGAAVAIAAACAVCAPFTGGFEGFVPKAKPDPIGIETGCFGERVDQSDLDPSRIYTRSECTDRLRGRLAREYAPKIIAPACLPQLAAPDRRNEFAAMLDTSYNAGPAAICASPMAAHFRAGDWVGGCSSLKGFYVGSVTKRPAGGALDSRLITSGKNRGKYFNRFRGLVTRRAFFAKLCATPESAPLPRR